METKYFMDQDDFLDHVSDIASKTRPWEIQPTTELKLESSAYGVIYHSEDGSIFKLRECSLRSLRQRLHSEADLVTKVSNGSLAGKDGCGNDAKLFANYIDWAKEVLKSRDCKEKTKVAIVDGEVNAFLSEEYVEALDSKYVFDTSFEEIIKSTNEQSFGFKGWWSYAIAYANYITNIIKSINGTSYKTVIGVRTSDAGYSSIALNLGLTTGNNFIPMMSEINIPHRGSKSKDINLHRKEFSEQFAKALKSTDDIIKNAVAKAEELSKIVLNNPSGCAQKLAKEIGLLKEPAKQAIKNNLKGNTAWDIYVALSSSIKDDWSVETRIKHSGNIVKLLSVNWQQYDQPYEWR